MENNGELDHKQINDAQVERAVLSEPPHQREIVAWLKEHAHPLQSIEPESPVTDLEPMRDMIGDARVVGMGEATHGNKEFTQIRHKMFRFMVEELGFNGLILETFADQGEKINEYIQTGNGDIGEILDQGYWVHNNQEMIDTVEWMREFNKNNPTNRLTFKGCDIPVEEMELGSVRRDKKMAENTLDIVNEQGDNAKFVLWSHNYHISDVEHQKATSQGHHLRKALGDQYLMFGTQCTKGTFTALFNGEVDHENGEKYLRRFPVPRLQNSYASTFAQAGYQYAVLDLRETFDNQVFEDWRNDSVNSWQLGAGYDPTVPVDRQYYSDDLSKRFDALIYIDSVTASEPRKIF